MKTLGRVGWLLFGAWLLTTFGCATLGPPSPPVRDGQEQAVWIIWHEAYGRNDRPPIVHWKQGTDLVCEDPGSGRANAALIEAGR